MTQLFRHEASALRLLRSFIAKCGHSEDAGCYRLQIYYSYADGDWTLRDFMMGFDVCLREKWIKWDPQSTFVTLTKEGADWATSMPVDITISDTPNTTASGSDHVIDETKDCLQPTMGEPSIDALRDYNEKLEKLLEGGWIDVRRRPIYKNSAAVMQRYLASQIDFRMMERQLFAIIYATMDFPGLQDD